MLPQTCPAVQTPKTALKKQRKNLDMAFFSNFLKKNKQPDKKNKKVVLSALLMAIGTFISRILGLVRDMVIAAFFTRTETDAFFVAFRIPNFSRRFLGEGALTISFIPIFISNLNQSSNKEQNTIQAKNFMNSIYTILLAVVSVITVLGILLTEPLVNWLFANTSYAEVEGKMNMTIVMAKILFIYLFLVTMYAYLMAIANALGRFFLPALAAAFLNIGMIAFSFLPKENMDIPPLLLCYGVLTGGLLQIAMTAGLLWKMKFLPSLSFSFPIKNLKLMASKFFPGILGVGGFAIIGLLNLYFSGLLEEGTHTFIYYGDRLLELPRSLIAISMGTALLPSLSHLLANEQKKEMLNMAAHQRDILLFLILPCALGFYYLGLPIVEVLFQRGHFTPFASYKTNEVLQIYSVLLITSSLARVLATCFYAIKNTWYPALTTLLYVLFHWLLTPYMLQQFELKGLIWATVISNAFLVLLLIGAYPFFIGSLCIWRSTKRLLYSIPALTIFSLYLHFSFDFLTEYLSRFMEINTAKTTSLFFVIISSMILYLGISALLRIPQAKECIQLFKQKLNKRKL